jgi:hypothetical protein
MMPLILFLLLIWAVPADAHKPSDSYLFIAVKENTAFVQWDIALRDLDYAVGLDANDDGNITWGELRAQHDAIAAFVLPRLQIEEAGVSCQSGRLSHQVARQSDGAYAVLQFESVCKKGPDTVAYHLFFDLDPTHRGLLQFTRDGVSQTILFSPGKKEHSVAIPLSAADAILSFGRHGVDHILSGWDHLLFLLSLLLPSVLNPSRSGVAGVPRLLPAFFNVLRVVTAFTLAHCITLSLAVLERVSYPSIWVESAIAGSIIFAAVNNIRPWVINRLWLVAFGFGLIHGFGFAGFLKDFGLPKEAVFQSLLGFNLGVEAGQIGMVALFFPVAFVARHTRFYQRIIFFWGSILIAAIGAVWLIERIFNLDLPYL